MTKKELDIKAVIFDIDGTLSEKNSWQAIALAMGATWEEDLAIYHAEKNGELSSEEATKRILALWNRNGLATKKNFSKIFNTMTLRSGAIEIVSYLKQKEIIVCLITGSMDMYAEVMARRIKAHDFYSNAKLTWDKNEVIQSFSYEVNQGQVKVEQFNDFLKKNQLRADNCVVVGDSGNDYGLFELTKQGIVIRSEYEDKELEAIAWKVIQNLGEIKEIIK